MLGSRPLSRTTAFAPRRDSRSEKPFHQERPALFVASPNHNPKLPILSISYLSRFPALEFPGAIYHVMSRGNRKQASTPGSLSGPAKPVRGRRPTNLKPETGFDPAKPFVNRAKPVARRVWLR